MSIVSVDSVTGEVLEVPAALTAEQARELTDEIRQTLRVGHDLIIRAFRGSAWSALGYATWDAYCAGEFAEARMIRLDREQRREIVAEMRQAGMPIRAIAQGIGVSPTTVEKDIAPLSQSGTEPSTVTGTNGVERPSRWTDSQRQSRTPAAAPKTSPRRPLGDAFTDATYDLNKVTERLERLCADDRFPHNAEQVATKNRGDLLRAAEALAGVLSRLS